MGETEESDGDKIFVGVDPGFTGYITLVDANGKYVKHIKTPILVNKKEIKKRTGKKAGQIVTKTKTELDELQIMHALKEIDLDYKSVYITIEKQHAMTGQGLASTAKNMYGYGFWVGLSKGFGWNVYVASAVEWQKVTSDPKAEDKKAASVASVKKWNKDLDLRKTKRSRLDDHNLADSVNIARFTWHKFGQTGEVTNG